MDRKSLIGLLLMGVLLVAYGIFSQPSKEERARQARINDSIYLAQEKLRQEEARAISLKDSAALANPATPEEISHPVKA